VPASGPTGALSEGRRVLEAQARALGPVTARPLGVDLDAVKASLGTDGPGDGPR